jgi:histone H1/5
LQNTLENMSYKESIIEVINELGDRNGSSMIAIKKKVMEKIPNEKKWLNATFLQALKNGVTAGDFVKTKVRERNGVSLTILFFVYKKLTSFAMIHTQNSYKLSAAYKKKVIDAAKPKPVKKVAAVAPKKKTTSTKTKTTVKKVIPKKKATTATKTTSTKKKTVVKKKAASATTKKTGKPTKTAASSKKSTKAKTTKKAAKPKKTAAAKE